MPNADSGGESRERHWVQGKERLWGNKMLEGDILREMLSVTTPSPQKTAKSTKIHKMLHVPEFSSFTDSLGCKWKKKSSS